MICKANYIGTEFVLTHGEAIITPLQRTLPSPPWGKVGAKHSDEGLNLSNVFEYRSVV